MAHLIVWRQISFVVPDRCEVTSIRPVSARTGIVASGPYYYGYRGNDSDNCYFCGYDGESCVPDGADAPPDTDCASCSTWDEQVAPVVRPGCAEPGEGGCIGQDAPVWELVVSGDPYGDCGSVAVEATGESAAREHERRQRGCQGSWRVPTLPVPRQRNSALRGRGYRQSGLPRPVWGSDGYRNGAPHLCGSSQQRRPLLRGNAVIRVSI